MLVSVSPVEGVHRALLNSDDMMEVTKIGCQCTGYRCNCNDDQTQILMRSGHIYVVEESINTLEARIERMRNGDA